MGTNNNYEQIFEAIDDIISGDQTPESTRHIQALQLAVSRTICHIATDNKNRIEEMNGKLNKLLWAYGLQAVIAALVASLVIGLLFSILTGEYTLVRAALP